jgi:elongation factor G
VVDLLKMKAIIWDEASQGMKFEYEATSRPNWWNRQEVAREDGRSRSRSHEELMNKYLEEGDLTEDEIKRAAQRTIATEIQPMLCGTAFKNKGVQRMLDAVIDFLPSPVDIPPVAGHRRRRETRHPQGRRRREVLGAGVQADDRPVRRPADFVRVYSGVLTKGDTVYNPSGQERAHRPYRADARQRARRSRRNPRRRHRRLRGL